MKSTATTVAGYLASLPSDRRDAIARVRQVVNANLPGGFEETLQWGMISWVVPETALPAKDVYNKQPLALASLASQKHHMALYLLAVYGDAGERAWFERAYKASGKKLDMGKSCVRFTSLGALPLDVIGEAMSRITVDRYVAAYLRLRGGGSVTRGGATRASNKAASANRPAANKPAANKPAANKPAANKPAANKPSQTRR